MFNTCQDSAKYIDVSTYYYQTIPAHDVFVGSSSFVAKH